MTNERRRKIVVPGGTGQVGRVLARWFSGQGHEVVVLSRRPNQVSGWREVAWDGLRAGPWVEELEGADVCINLAGRSVNCRYGEANRREIYDSRILSTRLLGEAMGALRAPPRVWLNASTATIYRHALDRAMDERTGELGGDEPGAPDTWNFSIRVAKDWEREFFAPALGRTRRVALRSAITMSPDRGGALGVLLNLVRLGLGGAAGSGEQYVSWIHERDFVRAVEWLMEGDEWEGAVNLAAPEPLPNREFMRKLREAWGMPVGLPAYEWMVEVGAVVLRTESELVLKSRRVVPGRLSEAGFRFEYPEWGGAARELVGRFRGA